MLSFWTGFERYLLKIEIFIATNVSNTTSHTKKYFTCCRLSYFYHLYIYKLQILEVLYKNIKLFLSKINFIYSSHILNCLQHFSHQFLSCKILFFGKIPCPFVLPPTLYIMHITCHCVCHFIKHLIKDGSSRGWKYLGEKYRTFWNSFYPGLKWLIWRLEWIKNKIVWNEVSVLFNQTCLKEKMPSLSLSLSIYIYVHNI